MEEEMSTASMRAYEERAVLLASQPRLLSNVTRTLRGKLQAFEEQQAFEEEQQRALESKEKAHEQVSGAKAAVSTSSSTSLSLLPLFDMPQYMRALESIYVEMWETFSSGAAASHVLGSNPGDV
jgi:predicted O-linked N-acetylglucosamine transferase (SPINDLY family)